MGPRWPLGDVEKGPASRSGRKNRGKNQFPLFREFPSQIIFTPDKKRGSFTGRAEEKKKGGGPEMRGGGRTVIAGRSVFFWRGVEPIEKEKNVVIHKGLKGGQPA